jgi:aquaporin Z
MGRRFNSMPVLPPFGQACLTELLGTYFFVLIISLAAVHSPTFVPIAAGFGLTMLIYSYGYVSKAQFNPAVSIGLFVSGIQDFKVMSTFIVIQLVAGLAGAFTGLGLLLDTTQAFAPAPYNDTGAAQARAFFAEFLFTFILAQTMINVAVSRQGGNSHFGLAIGMAVLTGGYAVGVVSGGAFNPAVTFGLQMAQLTQPARVGLRRQAEYIWLYWLAQCLAGACAGIIFHLLDDEAEVPKDRPNDYGHDAQEGEQAREAAKQEDPAEATTTRVPVPMIKERDAKQRVASVIYGTDALSGRPFSPQLRSPRYPPHTTFQG